MTVTNIERNQGMIRTKLMLLGLCAALFGVMAFGASGAQAAKWLILMSNGEVLTAEQLLANLGAEIDSPKLILHTEVLKDKYLIECTGLELIGVGLESEGKLTEGGKVKFTGCVGLVNGSVNKLCTPKSNGTTQGTILTNEGKGVLVLHELTGGTKDGLTKIEPKVAGGSFVNLEMEEGCAIGEKLPINGVLYVKDCEGKLETHLVKHLGEEGPLTELWATSNKTEEHTAHILGSVWFFLTGAHAGLAWSGMPE
jgi:hypothetical protein